MFEVNDTEVTIQVCTFEGYFERATVNLKFPSLFFVEWKSMNSKNSVSMISRKRAIDSVVDLDEAVSFTTEMIFHKGEQKYLKKESLLNLNLISNSRPDQIKLVGRVILDLSNVANHNSLAELSTFKLMYCSVDADLSFRVKMVRNIDSNLQLNQLDKSSFSDLYSFTSPRADRKAKFDFKDTRSDKRSGSERKKIHQRISEKEEVVSRNGKNILIKDQPDEGNLMLNSVPISQHKAQPIQNNIKETTGGEVKLDEAFYKEKDMLEKELGEHKNRIQKLEEEILKAANQFERSQENELKSRENKLRAECEEQIARAKEQHQKQIEMIKGGHEADLKLLQATMEEERLKKQSNNNSLQIQELNAKVQQMSGEMVALQEERDRLKQELQAKADEVVALERQLKEKESGQNKQTFDKLAELEAKTYELDMEINHYKIEKQEMGKEKQSIVVLYEEKISQLNQELKTARDSLGQEPEPKATPENVENVESVMQKNSQLEEVVKVQESKLSEFQKIHQEIKEGYENKMQSLLQDLQRYQSENERLMKMTQQNIKTGQEEKPAVDEEVIKKCQLLEEENAKITEQLQLLSMNKAEESNGFAKAKEEKEEILAQKLLLEQNLKLQELQISQLKGERATLKETMQKLVQQHQELKSSRNQVNNEGSLEQITRLKIELQNERTQNESNSGALTKLKEQLEASTMENTNLKVQIQQLKQKMIQPQPQPQLNNQQYDTIAEAVVPATPVQMYQFEAIGDVNVDVSPDDIKTNPTPAPLDSPNIHQRPEEAHNQDRHNFNFQSIGEHLTAEDINNLAIPGSPSREEQMNEMRMENIRLKEEIEDLRSQKTIKEEENESLLKQRQNFAKEKETLLTNEEGIKRLEQQKQTLEQHIANLKEQLSQLIKTEQTVVLFEPGSANNLEQIAHQPQTIQIQSYNKLIADQKDANSNLLARVHQLQQQMSIEIDKRSTPNDKYSSSVRELEERIFNMEEDMKLKDEILYQNQRKIEESYQLKYQLADLKDKCIELESALKERDNYINQLEEAKEYISREIIQLQSKKEIEDKKQQFQIHLQKISEEKKETPEPGLEHLIQNQISELRAQVQNLSNQLLQINRQNQELKSKIEEEAGKIPQKPPQSMEELNSANADLKAEVEGLKLELGFLTSKYEEGQKQKKEPSQQIPVEAPKEVANSQQLMLQSLKDKNSQLQQELSQLKKVNEELCKKIEQSGQLIEKLTQQISIINKKTSSEHKESHSRGFSSILNQDHQLLPQLQVHTIQSNDQGNPLHYSGENIPLDASRKGMDHVKQDHLQQIEQLKKQIASLTFDLAQESEQRCRYFSQCQKYQGKIAELQDLVKHLREQQEKFSGLPLQSFEQSPKYARKAQEVAKDSKQKEPSILEEMVKNQVEEMTPINPVSDTPKQKNDTYARLQTNVSQEEYEIFKKEVEMIKEELDSERKLHSQLQELHKICGKKYQLLEIRFQNSCEQLEFYQTENQDLTRRKKLVEDQVYDLRAKLEELKEPKVDHLLSQNAQAVEKVEEPKEKEGGKEEERQVVRQEEVGQKATSEEELRKNILELEEKIVTLQSELNKQLETNKNYSVLQSKLNRLEELQFMAQQCRAEMEEMRKENDSLKSIKNDYEVLSAEKGQLTKLIEAHALWEEEKTELHKKLTQIESKFSSSSNKFSCEKEELQQKLNSIEEEKATLEVQKSEMLLKNQSNSENSPYSEKAAMAREMELIEQMALINEEKIKHLERVAELEGKINTIESGHSEKIIQLQQAILLKDHQIQQLKFVVEQLRREAEEHKLALNSLSIQKEIQEEGDTATLQQNYQNTLAQLQVSNAEIARLTQKVVELQNGILRLTEQIKTLEEEKMQSSAFDHISSQVEKLQLEIAHKVAFIEELQAKNVDAQSKLHDIAVQFEQNTVLLEEKDKQIAAITEEKQSLGSSNQQLNSQVDEIKIQLEAFGSKYSLLQSEKNILKKGSEEKQKNIQAIQQQMKVKATQLASFEQKVKQREQELVKLAKELQTIKLSNERSELKVKQLGEKQKLLKEAMVSVESESKKLIQALKERYKSEETYYHKYIQKQQECSQLGAAAAQVSQTIANKDRELQFQQQKAQKLMTELQTLKGAGAEANPKRVSIQYEKYQDLMTTNDQIMNKNSQYIQMLRTKTSLNAENQRLKGQVQTMSAALSQLNSQYSQLKSSQEGQASELSQKIQAVEQRRKEEAEKVQNLLQELSNEKEGKPQKINSYIDNLIKEKNKEIELLKQKVKQNQGRTSNQPDVTSLNEQINQLNHELLKKESELIQLKKQLSKVNSQEIKLIPQQQVKKEQKNAPERVNQYKSQMNSLEEQIIKLKTALQSASRPIGDTAAAGTQNLSLISHQLHKICSEIRQICEQRTKGEDHLFQTVIQKYDQIEEQFFNLNLETSLIQEKARFISKELQKVKAYIIKSQSKTIKEKQEILELIKPCENAAGELVTISETLSERESNTFL